MFSSWVCNDTKMIIWLSVEGLTDADQNPTLLYNMIGSKSYDYNTIWFESKSNAIIKFDGGSKSYAKPYAWDFDPHHGSAIRILDCGLNPTQKRAIGGEYSLCS